ncbi:CoA transferase [Chelatococcus reniformis]|uniref:Carnitine dehydratase n=1 Tax=Chelatococcus reniformis TaxID=1494448 RepID=A0A916TX61_9HYPH|nr:CoA transferase [Chelatococcus reniformis]GGC50023.1 carnitine dehydratase [Chelatococcus reniformis]
MFTDAVSEFSITDHLDQLLQSVGLGRAGAACQLSFAHADPLVRSPHRLGAATAIVLAAQAVGICEIWRMRTKRTQTIAVDLAKALQSLTSLYLITMNDHAVDYRMHLGPIGGHFGQTGDGRWIFLVGAYPHHRDKLLSLLRCWNEPESIRDALLKWNSLELEDAANELKCPAAVVRSAEEWRAHPQGGWLQAKPVVEIRKLNDTAPVPFDAGQRPLSGIRVLDMAYVLAGPLVSRTMSEQGAEVLHLQSSMLPDLLGIYLDGNVGKRSAFFDLGNGEDEAKFGELLERTDVVVDSYRAGSLARRGYSAEDLAARRPGLIHVYLNCYGAEGPWAARGGFDQLSQCVSGVAATEGGFATPRLVPTYLINDYLAGYLGALGALAALIRRAREGGSYSVRVSLARSSMWMQDLGLLPGGQVRQAPERAAPPDLISTATPFGRMQHVGPVTAYSDTRAYWELPVAPVGAHPLAWT